MSKQSPRLERQVATTHSYRVILPNGSRAAFGITANDNLVVWVNPSISFMQDLPLAEVMEYAEGKNWRVERPFRQLAGPDPTTAASTKAHVLSAGLCADRDPAPASEIEGAA